MKYKVTALLLLLFLTGTSLLSFILPDHYFSVREKRKLVQLPEFEMAGIRDKTYLDDLEDYLTDQFPGRDGWITLKTAGELVMGRRERSGVYIGSEGFLMDAFRQYDPAFLEANLDQLCILRNQLRNLPFYVLPVPMAAQILTEKLPPAAPVVPPEEILDAMKNAGLPVIDVTASLKAHREEPIYYRTDHHYTSLGAWYCWTCWQEARGREAGQQADWTKEILTEHFRGTTWSRVGLPWIRPDSIEAWYQTPHAVLYNGTEKADSFYDDRYLEKDPYGVFLNSNQALSVIQGGGEAGKLLLIKDSFGNTFAQFPAEDFREVHVIDLRFFTGSVKAYAEENGITEVLVLYGMQNLAQQTKILIP